MNQLIQTFVACVATGTLFTSLCAALSVPVATWLGVRLLAPAIRARSHEYNAQSALSAWAAAAPGAVFLFLVAYGLVSGFGSTCLQTLSGRVIYAGLAIVMLGAIARALLRAVRRHREAARAISGAVPPAARLSRIAADAGIDVAELPDEAEPIVMLYGSVRPRAYVSRKALRTLSDSELFAALQHERGHRERGDHQIAPILYFLTDLLPLPVGDLLETYIRAREYCADSFALRHANAAEIAAALLRMSRSGGAPAYAAAFSDADLVRDRLNVLLRPNTLSVSFALPRLILVLALGVIWSVSVIAPLISMVIFQCSSMGFSS